MDMNQISFLHICFHIYTALVFWCDLSWSHLWLAQLVVFHQNSYSSRACTPWLVLPYLGMVGRFRCDDPHFGDFQSDWVHFYTQHSPTDPLVLQKKIWLSLSHLVPEILAPKVSLIFHQNVLFNRFWSFYINFFLHFQFKWPPFHWF